MRMTLALLALTACGGAAPAPSAPPTHEHHAEAPPSWKLDTLARGAGLMGELGNYSRKTSARVPEAQAYFDQGLQLTYGFNHDEAARSYAKAAELDPSCAICWWGVAYTLGPNYNIPMLPDRSEAAWDAIGRAQKQAAGASPVERALIGALAKRYKGAAWIDPVAQAPYNEAYAKAMREVAVQFPADDDVQALFAEALMNLNPWKLWSPDGKPAPGTPEILEVLERILARSPNHPGANHFYIHAVEASATPGKAAASADRLAALMPNAGHTVHMPAHIYQRVGRYADAALANRAAIQVDRRTIARLPPLGYYPFYLAHNHGFLAFSLSMIGQGAEALAAARESAGTIPRDIVCGMPGMDFFLAEPLLVMVRFGRWQEILAEPKPDAKYQVLTALWHHAHGMASASTGKLADARADLAAIQAISKALPPDLIAGLNAGKQIADVSAKIVEARIAEIEKRPDAIALWEQAVALEDGLAYSEPADWFYPTRHYLGAVLLDAGRAKEAEAVYRADLLRNPGNGWGLFGLWKALAAQKKGEASTTEATFRRIWKDADVQLTRTGL